MCDCNSVLHIYMYIQVVSLEKELSTCRVEGQDLKQKGTALLTSLTRLSGETVTLSEEEEGDGGEGDQGAEMKEDTAKSGLVSLVT